jgi:acetyl-CoA carboxylase biotin carboxyl carrier protein
MGKRAKQEPRIQVQGVDLPEIEQLLGFMQKHGLEEFEYERNGLRIRLKKLSPPSQGSFRPIPAPEIVVAGSPSAANPRAPSTSEGATSALREAGGEGVVSDDLHVVKSPIVGTFYSSPSPGVEAFVSVGAHVETGQVLCIIEAMKLMNEIESEVAGEVVRIFVENGQPVEYGEPLFGIHPHRKK